MTSPEPWNVTPRQYPLWCTAEEIRKLSDLASGAHDPILRAVADRLADMALAL